MKTTNINASLYNKEFQVYFECAGEVNCQFALCEIMPPDGQDECSYRQYGGACKCVEAQVAALRALKEKLSRQLKDSEKEMEETHEAT